MKWEQHYSVTVDIDDEDLNRKDDRALTEWIQEALPDSITFPSMSKVRLDWRVS
jgi:hypothetical protein